MPIVASGQEMRRARAAPRAPATNAMALAATSETRNAVVGASWKGPLVPAAPSTGTPLASRVCRKMSASYARRIPPPYAKRVPQ